ncbi:MAG TPA: nitroreductase family protein [Terriglobales bacterium]|nr:nitroreductase family protein [Terriglobales bacterium]
MNEVIQNLHTRKSVRIFEDREIPRDVKREILLAAAQAPTAGNQQLYTILDITDQRLEDRLAVTCDNQPFIAKAPLVLIFCADAGKWYDVYREGGCAPRKPGPGDFVLAVCDACIAAQNAVTAAWSLGVGSCYIGDIMEHCETHRELLKLPEYVFPAAMLILGYPTAQQLGRKKPQRCELSHIVHENAYRRMEGPELRGMLAHETEGTPFEDWCRAFCERKYNSDFSKEMSRSVAEYLKAYV